MLPFGPSLRSEWLLDPEITYLNHGTVGAPPRRVLTAQQEIRDAIERQPAQFLLRELADIHNDGTWSGPPPHMRAAIGRVAEFVGARPDDLVFVDNATTGANAVLRSFPFDAGDEVLVMDTSYGGVVRAADHATARAGAVLRTITLPPPGSPAASFADAIVAGLGDRTRLVLVDHITAPTALVLPVAEIARRCHERGVLVMVDGAHAPGAIAVDIESLGVDWYFGNLHKWAWAPRSCGILWAHPRHHQYLHPTVISWGYRNGLAAEFDLLGTRDPSAYLASPVAIDMLADFGFDAVCSYNHRLALDGAQVLADRWATDFSTPPEMIGTMASVKLPPRLGSTSADAHRVQDALLFDHGIEVPVFSGDPLTLRVAAQIYVGMDDLERLGEAVDALR